MASTRESDRLKKEQYYKNGSEKEKDLFLGSSRDIVKRQPGDSQHLNARKEKEILKNQESVSSRKRRILKNVFVINIAFFLLWSGFVGLSILQSSIVGDIGTISLGINFGCSIIACVVFGPLLIRLLGTKWTMFACFAGFCTWMSYNFYPVWETAIPAAVINGLSNGPIWTAQSTYFTICGLDYAELTNEREDVVLARFFGIFFCMVLIGISSGCGVTSLVLKLTAPPVDSMNVSSNATDEMAAAMLANCGADACPIVPEPVIYNGTEVEAIDPVAAMGWRLQAVTAVHVAFGVVGSLMILVLVDPQKQESNVSFREEARRIVGATVRQMKRKRQLLLTPLNIYAGLTQAFILADITMFYIVCAIGVDLLGFALMTYGVAACLASIFGATLIKVTGRIPLFIAGLVVHLIMHIFLLMWKPDPSLWYVFFIIPAMWAYGDGTLISQINALYGFLFNDNAEGAFATYRAYESFGIMLGYTYNSVLCVKYKIYILLVMFVLGVTGYIICEIVQKKYEKTHKQDDRELSDAKGNVKMSDLIMDTKISSM